MVSSSGKGLDSANKDISRDKDSEGPLQDQSDKMTKAAACLWDAKPTSFVHACDVIWEEKSSAFHLPLSHAFIAFISHYKMKR